MVRSLYYPTLSGFSKEKQIQIDNIVYHNRQQVYLVLAQLPLNGKRKAIWLKRKSKRIFLYAMFVFQISQPLAPLAAAVIVPLNPVAIHRVLPSMEETKIGSNKNYPQIARVMQSKLDKIVLTDEQMKDLNRICYKLQNGSITVDKAIVELRGGDLYEWVALAFFVYLFSLQEVESFQNAPLPHMDPIGWVTGKYDSKYDYKNVDQCPSYAQSRFDTHLKSKSCPSIADENGFFMTHAEAYKLVKETYPSSLQITEDCKVSDWQGAKKAYHFQEHLGLDLDKYPGFSKKDLVTLQKSPGGLIAYVRRGYKLPPIELVKDLQQEIYKNCHLKNTETNKDAIHFHEKTGETPCVMFFNRKINFIGVFNKTTGDLITAGTYRAKYFVKTVESGRIGN